MNNNANAALPDVVVNMYVGLFENKFKENGKQFSDVEEIILGQGTITFAFTRVRSEKSPCRITIDVTNADKALAVWHLACEPIGA